MKNVMRRAAISVLCAGSLAGVAPAQASTVWELSGPDRASVDAARADIPSVQARCRREDGQVVSSGVVATYAGTRFFAWVKCQSKRG